MDETKPEVLRQRCSEQSAVLRRRLDMLKDVGAGQPLVTVDFLVEVEKTLDGWENYQQALRHRGTAAPRHRGTAAQAADGAISQNSPI